MSDSTKPLQFDASAFDAATAKAMEYTGFDDATGDTTIPAGKYVCKIEHGGLKTTSRGHSAYCLRFAVVQPAEHAGAKVWSWHMLTDNWSCNLARAALGPLGLTNSSQFSEVYPPEGKEVFCECTVTRKESPGYGWRNGVKRFTVCPAPQGSAGAEQPADDTAIVNPFAVPLPEVTK